jgi:hypothetical protein
LVAGDFVHPSICIVQQYYKNLNTGTLYTP